MPNHTHACNSLEPNESSKTHLEKSEVILYQNVLAIITTTSDKYDCKGY